jgi:tetratricopeptide (TPR) repeat protein
LYPDDAEQGGGITLQARIARELSDKETELSALTRLTKLSSDNVPALLRLIQLHLESESWKKLREVAGQLLAVQPLITTGHEAWIEAVEKLGKPAEGTSSLRALQQLDPLDPAELHYRLARSLFAARKLDEARREVLFALEETPRYREAQELLLAITEARLTSSKTDPPGTLQIVAPDLNGSPPTPEIRRTGQ